jgi:HK97 family phage portal protein
VRSIIAELAGQFVKASSGSVAQQALDDRLFAAESSGGRSLAGVVVSASTAMRISAVYRCVSLIANTFAALPIAVYERVGDSRRLAPEHPLNQVLAVHPNRWQTSFEWRRLLLTWLLLRSNAYCQIVLGGEYGLELLPLHPDRISRPERLPSGQLRVRYTPPRGAPQPLIVGEDVWQLRGLTDDGVRGLSMLDLAQDSMGLALSSEMHSAVAMDRGLTFQGILQHPGTLKPGVSDEMGKSFTEKFGGLRGASRGVPVLWEGMKFEAVSMSMKDAEFMEQRKFSVSEIARWFGVPPHMVGDVERSTSWGTGIEEQRSDMTTFTMLPWVTNFEQSVQKHLLAAPDRYYVRMNLNAMLRPKTAERYQVYGQAIPLGIMSPNDARRLEEMDPREGGDVYVDPSSKPSMPPPPAPAPGPEPPAPDKRKKALAAWCARQLLDLEAAAGLAAAQKHAADADAWGHAVRSFFGRHAAATVEALGLSRDQARAYCARQEERMVAGGAAALEKWTSDHQPWTTNVALGEVDPSLGEMP